ncbi:MAG TPA: hypothetical protein VLX61_11995 [Anaerolineales bacterium]|nr:hypothetical protein [Anaerolineales bacterium]
MNIEFARNWETYIMKVAADEIVSKIFSEEVIKKTYGAEQQCHNNEQTSSTISPEGKFARLLESCHRAARRGRLSTKGRGFAIPPKLCLVLEIVRNNFLRDGFDVSISTEVTHNLRSFP